MAKGTLFYVIGASGAGKDSIMRYAREQLGTEKLDGDINQNFTGVMFAHRYITRAVELQGENHIELSPVEFRQRLSAGLFSMHWHSHNTDYAIGSEIDTWLEKGLNVVVNGSRRYFPEAFKRYPEMKPIFIQVSKEKLKQRLLARGRETLEQVESRLERAVQFNQIVNENMIVINNDEALSVAGDKFIETVTSSYSVNEYESNNIR